MYSTVLTERRLECQRNLLDSKLYLGILLLATGNLDLAISLLKGEPIADRILEGRRVSIGSLSKDQLCKGRLFESNRVKAKVLIDSWDAVWDERFPFHRDENPVELELCADACKLHTTEMLELGMLCSTNSGVRVHEVQKCSSSLQGEHATDWRPNGTPNAVDMILSSSYRPSSSIRSSEVHMQQRKWKTTELYFACIPCSYHNTSC